MVLVYLVYCAWMAEEWQPVTLACHHSPQWLLVCKVGVGCCTHSARLLLRLHALCTFQWVGAWACASFGALVPRASYLPLVSCTFSVVGLCVCVCVCVCVCANVCVCVCVCDLYF